MWRMFSMWAELVHTDCKSKFCYNPREWKISFDIPQIGLVNTDTNRDWHHTLISPAKSSCEWTCVSGGAPFV